MPAREVLRSARRSGRCPSQLSGRPPRLPPGAAVEPHLGAAHLGRPSGIWGSTPLVAEAFAVMMRIMTRASTPETSPLRLPPSNLGTGLMAVRHGLAMALLAAILISSGGSCPSVIRERMCSRGERAVRAIEAPDTGRTCVKNGQPPPPRHAIGRSSRCGRAAAVSSSRQKLRQRRR